MSPGCRAILLVCPMCLEAGRTVALARVIGLPGGDPGHTSAVLFWDDEGNRSDSRSVMTLLPLVMERSSCFGTLKVLYL